MVAALLASLVCAAAAAPPAQTPAEEYHTLKRRFEAAEQTAEKSAAQAPAAGRRRFLEETDKSLTAQYASQFLGLARRHPRDPAALDALTWVVMPRDWEVPQADQAIELLGKDHAGSERLGPVCLLLVYSPAKGAEAFLETTSEKNPHRGVRGAACYFLARHRHEKAKRLLVKDPKAAQGLDAEAARGFERAARDFGDVDMPSAPGKPPSGEKIAAAADKDLFELRHLSVGKRAPEIEGEDVDGNKFRLSDYKGKVVLLDFWGHW